MNPALLKKFLALEICGAVFALALAVIGVKLYTAARHFGAEKRELKAVMDRKELLDRRVPYPSPENLRQELENYKDILDNYNELNERLRAQQIEPQNMQAVEFMSLLEKTLRRLGKQLRDAQVVSPPNFKFSFERYAAGKPPAKEDVPRLVQQLKITDELCSALAKVGIAELVAIKREEFEGVPAAPRPNAPGGADALFTSQHFQLAVKADETAVLALLNLLARLPVFTVVTSLELVSPQPVLRPEALAGAAAAARGTPKDQRGGQESVNRERAPIIGRELVDLKLELDVDRFAPSLNFKENTDKKQ